MTGAGLVSPSYRGRQIGDRIHLSEMTVKNQLSRLLAELGVGRRVQAAVLAVRLAPRSHKGTGDPVGPR